MLSIIIPAGHTEGPYLNRTIENAYNTATGDLEVIVVLNGWDFDVDPRAVVIHSKENEGERIAMNKAAQKATGKWLLRIDAHCDFSPQGWDEMLCQVTPDKTITAAVLTAIYHSASANDKQKAKAKKNGWKDWDREPGHWYGFCRLVKTQKAKDAEGNPTGPIGLEAKWETPNRDHDAYNTVEPNMSLTGCGFCLRRDFYWELGGANEQLSPMGAIGEEFATKAWLTEGGKVQTRCDVVIGHVWGTGGYPTGPVWDAQRDLYNLYGDRYNEIAAHFPHYQGLKLTKTDNETAERTVVVERVDLDIINHPQTQKPVRRKLTKYRYVWLSTEHPDEENLTDQQIEQKYTDQGVKVGERTEMVPDDPEEVEKYAPLK